MSFLACSLTSEIMYRTTIPTRSAPENRRINVFGIDLAFSIMDGADLSEHRRRELALALLMSEIIGVILYTSESNVDVRIDAATDLIREFKHVYPEAMNV